MKIKKICLLLFMFVLFGCKKQEINLVSVVTEDMSLIEYDTDTFSMKTPSGYTLGLMNKYENFGFHSYKKDMSYGVFYYGHLDPVLKSDTIKNRYKGYAKYDESYKNLSSSMVLSKKDVETLFNNFNDYVTYYNDNNRAHVFYKIPKFNILETFEYKNNFENSISKIYRISYKDEKNIEYHALIGSIISDSNEDYYDIYGTFMVYAISSDFYYVVDELIENISSYQLKPLWHDKLSEEYLKYYNDFFGKDMLKEIWSTRDKSIEVKFLMERDKGLKYERIVDTSTNKVYFATEGFYSKYDKNKNKYVNQNLKLVTSEDKDLFSVQPFEIITNEM